MYRLTRNTASNVLEEQMPDIIKALVDHVHQLKAMIKHSSKSSRVHLKNRYEKGGGGKKTKVFFQVSTRLTHLHMPSRS